MRADGRRCVVSVEEMEDCKRGRWVVRSASKDEGVERDGGGEKVDV